MCIIVYKPKGIALPKRDILENCWNNNNHGAGIMVKKNNQTQVIKGFMTFGDFIKAYNSFKFTKDCEFALHFRIGTSGRSDGSACHPFPITDQIEDLRKLEFTSKNVFCHNGIIGKGDFKKDLSDTQMFSIDILSTLIEYIDNPKVISTIENIIGSNNKLCIFSGEKTYLVGNFIKEKTGIYYSNNTYLYYYDFNFDIEPNKKKEKKKYKYSSKHKKTICPCCNNSIKVYDTIDHTAIKYGYINECLFCGIYFDNYGDYMEVSEIKGIRDYNLNY